MTSIAESVRAHIDRIAAEERAQHVLDGLRKLAEQKRVSKERALLNRINAGLDRQEASNRIVQRLRRELSDLHRQLFRERDSARRVELSQRISRVTREIASLTKPLRGAA